MTRKAAHNNIGFVRRGAPTMKPMLNETGGYGDVIRSNWSVTASKNACTFLISGFSWSGVLFLFIRNICSHIVTINKMVEEVDLFSTDDVSHSAQTGCHHL